MGLITKVFTHLVKKQTPLYDQPCSMLRLTRAMMKYDRRTIPQLHEASGLPFYWLRKFRNGTIEAPSINRVQFLYDFLLKSRLQKSSNVK